MSEDTLPTDFASFAKANGTLNPHDHRSDFQLTTLVTRKQKLFRRRQTRRDVSFGAKRKIQRRENHRKSISYWIHWGWIVIGALFRSFIYAARYGLDEKPRRWNGNDVQWMFGGIEIE